MATVKAPKTEKMDEINGKSVVSYQIVGNDAVFYNRAGVAVATLPIKIPPSYFTTAIKRIGSTDIGFKDYLIKEFSNPVSPNLKLADPSVLPNNSVQEVCWSPNGVYLAVTNAGTGYTIYKRSGDVLTKLTDGTTMSYPDTSLNCLSWSPNSDYLAITSSGTTRLGILYRVGDTFTISSTISSPAMGVTQGVRWSSDNNYLAVAESHITWFKKSGSTLTELPDPEFPFLEASGVYDVDWSPDGIYLAALIPTTSPYLVLYKRSGDTLTYLPNAVTTPSRPQATGSKVRWSPDGQYVAVTGSGGDKVYVYKRSGDMLIWIPGPVISGSVNGRGLAWSPDNKYLVVSTTASPYVFVFRREGDVFTRQVDLATIPPSGGRGSVDFSPDGKHLAVGYTTTPFVSIYKSAMAPINGLATRID